METVVGLYSEVFETAVVLGVFHGLFNNKIYQRIKILWIYDWQTYQYSTLFELRANNYVKRRKYSLGKIVYKPKYVDKVIVIFE